MDVGVFHAGTAACAFGPEALSSDGRVELDDWWGQAALNLQWLYQCRVQLSSSQRIGVATSPIGHAGSCFLRMRDRSLLEGCKLHWQQSLYKQCVSISRLSHLNTHVLSPQNQASQYSY
eukprot:scaffold183231_cov18-Tisochrysis_lutea.AAC.1